MSEPQPTADNNPERTRPRRMRGETWYVMLLSAPRVIAEGIRVRLEQSRIPVHLETPFTGFGLPEAYIGTYTGDVSLWVPEALYDEALLIIERDQPGEAP